MVGKFGKKDIQYYCDISAGMSPQVEIFKRKSTGSICFVDDSASSIRIEAKKYSRDFIVQEITPSGEILTLKSNSVPLSEEEYQNGIDKAKSIPLKDLAKEGIEKLRKILNSEQVEAFQTFLEKCDAEKAFSFYGQNDKTERAVLHKVIRENFKGFDSQTCDKSVSSEDVTTKDTLLIGQKRINVYKKTNKNFKQFKRSEDDRWFDKTGKHYLHFVLLKQNVTTIDSIMAMSLKSRRSVKSFGVCGNKDKKAYTTQRMSMYRMTAKRMLGLVKYNPNVFIGNFSYQTDKLKLGDLKGNHFTITLRNIKLEDKEALQNRLKIISKQGIINYYGKQRFGTGNVPTHFIGTLVLKEKWDSLIALLLFPKSTNKFVGVESFGERNNAIENVLLNNLEKLTAKESFLKLSKRLRSLYVHAYQSYVWNNVVSERILKGGFNVCLGDLVAVNTDKSSESNNKSGMQLERVFEVKEEDIERGTYTIFDVVLPLPCPSEGSQDKKQPEIENIMEEDGITMEMFRKLNQNRSMMIFPHYRHIMIRPKNFSWDFVDSLDSEEHRKLLPKIDLLCEKQYELDSIDEIQPSSLLGCVLKFDLASSEYATVILREISR